MDFSKIHIYGYRIYIFTLFVSILLASCSKEDTTDISNDNISGNVKVALRQINPNILDNLNLYVFDENNSYVQTPTLTRDVDTIYTWLKTKTWNLYLISCIDQNITTNSYFKAPISGVDINSLKLWETGLLAGDSLLDKTPEILYDTIANVIVTNSVTKKSSILSRNVAKIQVIVDHSSFDINEIINPVFAGDRFVELYNVPTTLTWSGGLYPNKTNPSLATKPLREYITFDANNKIDTINFIVPAHRGLDALSPSPADTTTQKLSIKACLPLNGKRYFGKDSSPIEIPFVPKMNRIIQVKLRLNLDVKLDIKVTIKDWVNYTDQTDEFN